MPRRLHRFLFKNCRLQTAVRGIYKKMESLDLFNIVLFVFHGRRRRADFRTGAVKLGASGKHGAWHQQTGGKYGRGYKRNFLLAFRPY